jgi:hypothetical protein
LRAETKKIKEFFVLGLKEAVLGQQKAVLGSWFFVLGWFNQPVFYRALRRRAKRENFSS